MHLSRRLFQQLTDSILLGRPVGAASYTSAAAANAVPRCRPTALAPPSCTGGSHRCPSFRPRIPVRSASLLPAQQYTQRRCASSSSSNRWKMRQTKDRFAREAKVQGLKSRAAFKLLEMNEKYRLFHAGDTVVDLGYAPGSWSQVALNRTRPGGRVVGIDVIPAQPPRGVSTLQGNFLSPAIREELRRYVQDPQRGRAWRREVGAVAGGEEEEGYVDMERRESEAEGWEMREVDEGYVSGKEGEEGGEDEGKQAEVEKEAEAEVQEQTPEKPKKLSRREQDEQMGRVVDVVLSDMSAPWEQTEGFHKRSVSDPYHRMMNTSGMAFRDHAGSMDLCLAALTFAHDTLRTGGHFLCKFYQGAEDRKLEKTLKRMFEKVHREKPESSRSESKEAYFVALRRKPDPTKEEVFAE